MEQKDIIIIQGNSTISQQEFDELLKKHLESMCDLISQQKFEELLKAHREALVDLHRAEKE